jgi:hypothetical protein
MLRIRLGAEDLMRIRVASALDPFAETMMAAGLIRRRSPSPVFRSWRRSLRGQLGGQLRPLASIFPADREWLDLATLVGQVATVEEGAEAFLAIRRQHLGQETEWLFVRHAQLPRSMWGLCT